MRTQVKIILSLLPALKEMMKPRFGGAIALSALVACTVADIRGRRAIAQNQNGERQ